jgi:lysophospholipase L1-like esterase
VDTNPAAFTVLCFGDSNTRGQRPDAYEMGRLPVDLRWTGRLQNLLGDRYSIIEEGLNGRTIDLDYADRPGCNGRAYLVPCLLSHSPLDLVVLMLGTNDIKSQFGRTADDIAAALGRLTDDIEEYAENRAGSTPLILLVSPIHIDTTRPGYAELTAASYDTRSPATSRGLATVLRQLAGTRRVLFADAATVAEPGDDGVHLTLDSHHRLAELLADMIGKALSP